MQNRGYQSKIDVAISRDKPFVLVNCGHHSVYMATNRIKPLGFAKQRR